jgi:uncharacterized protein (DUF2336 family)
MPLTAQTLLADLDAALPQTSAFWRSTALRQIVALFLSGAALYGREQIALFDEVICRLIKNADRTQLAELSSTLAGVDRPPPKILSILARHADIAISGPVLERAKALPDTELADIAEADRLDPNVLLKIASRGALSETVTDALLKRGNRIVRQKIVVNPNARISELGFARLISSIAGDKELAAAVAARKEVPPELRPFLEATLSDGDTAA